MRSIFTICTILCLSFFSEIKGQALNQALISEGLTESTAPEKIYVHYNSSLLFPGEYFLYTVYNLKDRTAEVSPFSKIAYVELVGEDGEIVFQQKVKLNDGKGSADFFVPTDTPSGNYKLVAYTNWMKNFNNPFFEGDVVIINPYLSSQNKLLGSAGDTVSTGKSTSITGSRRTVVENGFDLELSKKQVGNREKVVIHFGDENLQTKGGRYSLSVRKIGDLPVPGRITSGDMVFGNSKPEANLNKIYLPELRGQLISGRLISTDGNTAVNQRVVAMSIPGSKGVSETAITNDKGQFFFNLSEDLSRKNAVLEVLNGAGSNFQIELDGLNRGNSKDLHFINYKISPEMEEDIIQRSLYNQIENAYFSVKPDTLVTVEQEAFFPQNIVETYNLDDYTRFKGVPETFVEIIKSARVKQEGRGNRVFEVRGLLGHLPMGLRSLLMVDGLLVQDHSVLMDYDARRIKTIKIVRDKIYLGPEIFQGAVLIETVDGDFPDEYNNPDAVKVELMQPQPEKKSFKQTYSAENRNSRIPDYRYQLLWEAAVEPGEIEFFTSDIDGEYEVVLEGFTETGKPVSLRKTFTVK